MRWKSKKTPDVHARQESVVSLSQPGKGNRDRAGSKRVGIIFRK